DTLKLLPFLFLVFWAMEVMEHGFGHKSQALIEKAGKAGPFLGGLLGALPQCGFSVMVTNLYAGRVTTAGTLAAVYLSTSDEMLPILLSHKVATAEIIKILIVKAAIGIFAGFIIDQFLHPHVDPEHIHDICEEDHCDCEHSSPLKSAIHHTFNIFIVIVVVTLILNGIIELVGMDGIRSFVTSAGIFAPVLACLVGLIPNCAASVILTELYIAGAISFGTALAGLLINSGVAWVVLFRVNRHLRENLQIAAILVAISIASGVFCNAVGVVF
ncbi:MAG: arsenic efflux protein, partial [Firmicutes bacterium]|nr:arsenic efflux protein [Bacillota bacterium]